jgi:glucose-6-phosphate 1-dehydrogenase
MTKKFQQSVKAVISGKNPDADASDINKFIERCFYISGGYSDELLYRDLNGRLQELDRLFKTSGNTLFYFATPPGLYSTITGRLGEAGLVTEGENGERFKRIIFEKPFGRDLESALALDIELLSVVDEQQIYRIDHYLGKETVQNILMFRFANSIFEPVWNHNYIDHVQITVAESLGVGHRAGYYDQSGQLRDMFQNHMLQMLSMVAIEPPASFNADRIRDEKVKVMRAISPFDLDDTDNPCIVRAQYAPGTVDGVDVSSYQDEESIQKGSETETYVAAKLMINNWRWKGVPFYLRSGKRLAKKHSEIAITFKRVPHSMFYPLHRADLEPNVLVLNVQPEEGIKLTMQAKVPGPNVCLTSLDMDFSYRSTFGSEPPEPYERLLLDCMVGDQTLFWRNDGVEVAWSLLTPVLKTWESSPGKCPLSGYRAGSWGPDAADRMIKKDGREWRNPAGFTQGG